MITSVQGRLGIIFLAFFCLLIASVTAAFVILDTQEQDARIINLAGRQRMLLQQMTGMALEYENNPARYGPALREPADSFQQTLDLLRSGGRMVDYTGAQVILQPLRDPAWAAQLDDMQAGWQTYAALLDRLVDPQNAAATGSITRELEALAPDAIAQADQVVRTYEAISTGKIARLRVFQIVSMAVGIVLLSVGWWIARRSIVGPLAALRQAAHQIGRGQLDLAVPVAGMEEIQDLGQAMNTMRSQIFVSQNELQRWANTLENRVHQRTQELEALAAVSREINSHLAVPELLTSVTEKARQLTASEVASLCLIDQQGKVMSLHAASGAEASIQEDQSPADTPLAAQVLHQSLAQACDVQTCSGFCQIIRPEYRTSHMAAPLHARSRVIGALCVGSSQKGVFGQETGLILNQLAEVTAVALENSRLYQQAEQAATLEERQRIAAEMHDGLLQTLSFMGIMVGWSKDYLANGDTHQVAATLQQIKRAGEQAEREIRRAIASLQDDFPTNLTLQEQLRALAAEMSQVDPPVRFESGVILPVLLPRQESEQALRVVREAVLNAQHYSQASSVLLMLESAGGELVLAVADQGVGFEPGAASNDGQPHFGIKIMQARAARLGGQLDIQTAPGAGTSVRLSWAPSAGVQQFERG